jgi:hypothetical protein
VRGGGGEFVVLPLVLTTNFTKLKINLVSLTGAEKDMSNDKEFKYF